MLYSSIILLLLLLSYHYDVCNNTRNRDFWFKFVLVVFVCVAGFRWRLGIDTPVYIDRFYYQTPALSKLTFDDMTESPLFVLLNSIVFTMGGRFYVVQLIHAAFVNCLIFFYFKKHSKFLFTCILFYSIMCYTNFNMEIMKASMGIAISLFAYDYILDKKWIKGYFLILLAILFHSQFLPLLLAPLLFSIKLDKWGFLLFLFAFMIGEGLLLFLGQYSVLLNFDLLENKLSSYSSSSSYGTQGGNINFIIVNLFPYMLYSVLSVLFTRKYSKNINLLRFEPLVVVGLFFIVLRLNLEIAYRYVDCFKVYFILFYSEMFCLIAKSVNRRSRFFAYITSTIVFSILFMVCVGMRYFVSSGSGFRYYPYTSIFDREINKEREIRYSELNPLRHPNANTNEY